jgi:hypothetical protein
MTDYNIENLVNAFGEHYKQAQADFEERKKKYPDSLEQPNEFSICLALQEICKEIIKLKRIRTTENK